ncbi:hypothetical protein PYW07_005681 [Mythimna separata]|uniref:ArsA HSP20-like domain-containing protein n=1 Tax=Mythimna separata TaxID=271217 RepID=A0AAD8DRI4_MYTSE|nr:hypothetical protein PYW07_005681 [Mythimna separata]
MNRSSERIKRSAQPRALVIHEHSDKMIALLLCGIIAGACAAPQFSDFGTRMNIAMSHMSAAMSKLSSDLSRRLPHVQEGVEGTEYKVTVPLPNYEAKDIVVQAREGLLIIEAQNKNNHYSYNNVLPDIVNLPGNWIFENGVLKITFPLREWYRRQ